jgi:nucleosome binding factor SPN SPT16 subunit
LVKGKRIGWFPKDKYEGDFIKDWNKAVDQGGFEKVDASPLISAVLAVKDESELNCIKKACEITSKIYSKHLKVS